MAINLVYAIKFVIDMDEAVKFYRDKLGLPIKFVSPKWSEFATGDTTLALHHTEDTKIAGTVRLGFRTDDIDTIYKKLQSEGVVFTHLPETIRDIKLAEFLDSEGAECSLSG
jgi:lactoylglutathione lyase